MHVKDPIETTDTSYCLIYRELMIKNIIKESKLMLVNMKKGEVNGI